MKNPRLPNDFLATDWYSIVCDLKLAKKGFVSRTSLYNVLKVNEIKPVIA
jgi:hypothetical protein